MFAVTDCSLKYLCFGKIQLHTWFSILQEKNMKYHDIQSSLGLFDGLIYSAYTVVYVIPRNLPMQYCTCKQWNYSNVVVCLTVFDAYGHIWFTKVSGESWLLGVELYWGSSEFIPKAISAHTFSWVLTESGAR